MINFCTKCVIAVDWLVLLFRIRGVLGLTSARKPIIRMFFVVFLRFSGKY